LIPHELDIARVAALHEAAQVILDDEAPGLAPDGDPNARCSVLGLDLDDEAPQSVEPPRLSSPGVLFVA